MAVQQSKVGLLYLNFQTYCSTVESSKLLQILAAINKNYNEHP